MSEQSIAVPDKEFFSTGEVATHCAVTPNTVFKWVKSGKLPAERTLGGHFRISRNSLLDFLKARQSRDYGHSQKRIFQYCWEFHSRFGKTQDNCRKCIVYKSKASRCYELVRFANQIGHSKIYCTNSCDECDYYDMIHAQRISMLVITKRGEMEKLFREHTSEFDCSLRFTDSEYKCSRLIESFRPDYIIFDCDKEENVESELVCNQDFIKNICDDKRIPFTRIIVIGKPEICARQCQKMVFSFVDKPISVQTMIELVEETQL